MSNPSDESIEEKPPMDPNRTMLVAKNPQTGKEVGRKAAIDPKAEAWLTELARSYKGLTVDYVEDKAAVDIARMMGGF